MFHDTGMWCKVLRKIDYLWFGNSHEKFCKFPPENMKV